MRQRLSTYPVSRVRLGNTAAPAGACRLASPKVQLNQHDGNSACMEQRASGGQETETSGDLEDEEDVESSDRIFLSATLTLVLSILGRWVKENSYDRKGPTLPIQDYLYNTQVSTQIHIYL